MGTAAETARLEPWVQYTRPTPGAETVLVCFPYAGGAASAYREWVPQLAVHGVEVWPVQLTGREGRFREAPTTDLSVVAEQVMALLDQHLDGRSYAVFGHSAGAYMAYLLASLGSRLSRRVPLHVFVSASRPPAVPTRISPFITCRGNPSWPRCSATVGCRSRCWTIPTWRSS